MHRIVLGLIVFSFLAVQPSILKAQDQIRDLVVKIHAVHHTPDVLRPWTKNSPQQVKGSGVVIEGKRILTNAHVVRYASQIYVQPNQSAERIPARVEAMTPSMDLAVLKLDDESFFDKRGTLPFAEELPRVKDNINVYGYPTGGSELSVTQGIVSRIEYTDYYFQTSGLRIQVDAALNFGNSGGPAVSDGKLVGLVFSLIQNAQSIGYLIPVEEIQLFLTDIADGKYDGKPQLYDYLQTVENRSVTPKTRASRRREWSHGHGTLPAGPKLPAQGVGCHHPDRQHAHRQRRQSRGPLRSTPFGAHTWSRSWPRTDILTSRSFATASLSR